MNDDLLELILSLTLYGIGGILMIIVSPIIILGIVFRYIYKKAEEFAFNHDWIKNFNG